MLTIEDVVCMMRPKPGGIHFYQPMENHTRFSLRYDKYNFDKDWHEKFPGRGNFYFTVSNDNGYIAKVEWFGSEEQFIEFIKSNNHEEAFCKEFAIKFLETDGKCVK